MATSLGRFVWIIIIVTFGLFGLSPKDVGLRLNKIKEGLKLTVMLWITLESLLLVYSIIINHGFVLNPALNSLSPASIAVIIAYYFIGIALFEETFYRGFMIPQLLHSLRRVFKKHSMTVTLLVSQGYFAIAHIPHYSMPFPLPIGLSILLFTGIVLALLWLQTGNLFIVIGWHALMDLPFHITKAPDNIVVSITFILGSIVLLIYYFRNKHMI